eukprot:scaffold51774_cov22-Prasinocladus_malaysianus.AAC.1
MLQVFLLCNSSGSSDGHKGFGCWQGVEPPSDMDRADVSAFPYSESKEMADLTAEPFGEAGYSTLERRWFRPTLEVRLVVYNNLTRKEMLSN